MLVEAFLDKQMRTLAACLLFESVDKVNRRQA
jgi:hypothetical protein